MCVCVCVLHRHLIMCFRKYALDTLSNEHGNVFCKYNGVILSKFSN